MFVPVFISLSLCLSKLISLIFICHLIYQVFCSSFSGCQQLLNDLSSTSSYFLLWLFRLGIDTLYDSTVISVSASTLCRLKINLSLFKFYPIGQSSNISVLASPTSSHSSIQGTHTKSNIVYKYVVYKYTLQLRFRDKPPFIVH